MAAAQQQQQLPEDVLATILALDALDSAACTAAVRLVDKCFRRCKDAPLKLLSIDGTKISSVPNHFADASRLVEAFSRHMQVLTCLQISHLPSFGPLSGLPSSLHVQLQRLELLHCNKLLHGGDKSLAFHLRGISGLVNLQELVLSAPWTNLKGGCSLGKLVELLLPCRQLALLDLQGAWWSTARFGLQPLAKLSGLRSLSLSNCPQLRGLPSLGPALQLLQQLTALHLGECPWSHGFSSLKWNLPLLATCTNLQSLSLLEIEAEQRPEIQRAAFSLARLQHLKLCQGNQALPEQLACTQLLSLHLMGCSKMCLELRPLRALSRLTSLEVSGGGSVRDLEPLHHLRASLQSLDLQNMASTSLQTLGLLTRLRSLQLGEMDSEAATLQPLSSLTSLTRLYLHWVDSFPRELDVGPLATLTLLELLTLHSINLGQGEKILGLPQLLADPPRLPHVTELEIPLDSDSCAAPLALLTRLTQLCILNSGDVSGALLLELRALPGLQQLTLNNVESFPGGCLLQLSSLQALRVLTLDGCHLDSSSEVEELRLGSAQLTRLDLNFSYGFSRRAFDSLERDGLTLNYDELEDWEEEDDGYEEELEAEPEAWMERFQQLPDALKLQVLDSREERGASRVSLRLVCQQWRRLVDQDVKHLTLDGSVLIAQAPASTKAGACSSTPAPDSTLAPTSPATPGPGWRDGLRRLLSRLPSLTALNVDQLQLLGPGAADLVFGQLPISEVGPPSHKAPGGRRARHQAGGEAAPCRATLSSLTGLRSLRVSVPQLDDTELRALGLAPHLSRLQGLTELTIAAVTRAEDHTPPRDLTSLAALISTLQPLQQLHWLSLGFCQGLRSIRPLTRLTALRKLELSGLCHDAAASSVSSLVQLTRLSLQGLSPSLSSLEFLRPLSRLQDLLLDWKSYPCYRTLQLLMFEDGEVEMASFMHSHEVLDSLPPLPQLRLLQLDCAAVRSLEGLHSCPSLVVLNLLHNGPLPVCLDPLSSMCQQLERLDICCSSVDSLAPLQGSSSLQQLTLCLAERRRGGGGGSGSLLQELAQHPPPRLQELRLARYQFLHDPPGGGGGGRRRGCVEGFQRLRLPDVSALLVHCPSLQRLRLTSIKGLTYRLLDLMLYCKHPQQCITYCTLDLDHDLEHDLAAGEGPGGAGEEEEEPGPEGAPRLRQLAMTDFYHRKDRKFPSTALNAAG